jgi:hypothetical protein
VGVVSKAVRLCVYFVHCIVLTTWVEGGRDKEGWVNGRGGAVRVHVAEMNVDGVACRGHN